MLSLEYTHPLYMCIFYQGYPVMLGGAVTHTKTFENDLSVSEK